jgi:hypothetical protein
MGDFVNKSLTSAVAALATALALVLNLVLVAQTLGFG